MRYSHVMQNRLPMNNLNTFAAAAEHLSFQKAAESLYVTPSAVSHQMRNLEKILGYPLFDRLDKRVRLTTQGERLFNDIQMPIRQLHEASRKALRGHEDNTLALSVAPVFATGWLLPRLKNFHASHPDINLTVISTSDLVSFHSDPFDAAIRLGTGDWQELTLHRLFNSETIAICHPSMIRDNTNLFSTAEITTYQLVTNLSLPGLWNEWFQSAGIEISAQTDFSLQVQNAAQVIEALQSGDSIGLVDRNFIENDIKSGRLAIACEHVLQSEVGYFLVAPETNETLPSFQVFKDWVRSQLKADSES